MTPKKTLVWVDYLPMVALVSVAACGTTAGRQGDVASRARQLNLLKKGH